MTSTILLVVGILSVLVFFWSSLIQRASLAQRDREPTPSIQRWVPLFDGIGFILWSRAFATTEIQLVLFVVGSCFLIIGAYFAWRSIIARVRSRRSR